MFQTCQWHCVVHHATGIATTGKILPHTKQVASIQATVSEDTVDALDLLYAFPRLLGPMGSRRRAEEDTLHLAQRWLAT